MIRRLVLSCCNGAEGVSVCLSKLSVCLFRPAYKLAKVSSWGAMLPVEGYEEKLRCEEELCASDDLDNDPAELLTDDPDQTRGSDADTTASDNDNTSPSA